MRKYFAVILVVFGLTVAAYAQSVTVGGLSVSGMQMQAQCPGMQKANGQGISECEKQKCPLADKKQGQVKLCTCKDCAPVSDLSRPAK